MARIQLSAVPPAALANSIIQPLYDTLQVSTTFNTELLYFQAPAGSTGIGGTGSKTLADTNMTMNGTLSSRDAFAVRGYGIELLDRATAAGGYATTSDTLQDLADKKRFLTQTVFRFQTGSDGRKAIEVHPSQLPAAGRLTGFVTTGGTTTAGQNLAYIVGNGDANLRNQYALGKDFAEGITAGENFRGVIIPPTALSFSNSFNVRVYLYGVWMQAISV